MTIGEVARAVGIAPSAIRYYEAVGILTPPPRRRGARHYEADVIDQLRVIRFFRTAGVPIRQLLSIAEQRPRSKARRETWTHVLRNRIAALDALVEEAGETRLMLERAIACQCGENRDRCVLLQASD